VGSGGIMLPNHAPFIVAEQIGTLEALYPGASTWASGARRAPTRSRCARCAAIDRRRFRCRRRGARRFLAPAHPARR
jgi:hypothetical protein